MPGRFLHVRAICEYDGTNYFGFQIQADKPTIQGQLELVLARLTGEQIRIRYAGRTDTGVHGLGQVIALNTGWRHPIADLERAWNALLPTDIAVRGVELVSNPQFHPRYSARSRVYEYTIWRAPWRSPLHSRFAHHDPRPLDVNAMNQAAGLLLGSRDFSSFGQPTQGESTVREVLTAMWVEDGYLLRFRIEANAYLRRMVRSIVGTLLEAGAGMRPVDSISDLLMARNRALAGKPAPANGLCLVKVNY